MCSQYTLNSRALKLAQKYQIPTNQDQSLDFRVLPSKSSVVAVVLDGERRFQKMTYGLVPNWSKEAKVKFATYNARIETVLEKPTWRQNFVSRRCLVPLTGFFESITDKKYAGNIIQISQKEGELLSAAGLWDSWSDPLTGKTSNSFAILTTDPPEFISEAGHDRCPIFLKEEAFADWLNPENIEPEFLMNLLRKNMDVIDFKAEIDRPLKAGWENRK